MYQMLSQIPETGPWTAYVGLHPSVQNEAKESELQDLFHDGEKIRVERVRIVLHRDTGNVRSVFIDFMDAESLRNALHLRTSFHERPVKVEIAASREPKRPERPERPERPRSGFQGGHGAHGGIKATAYDVDTVDAEWMAKRVQEKLDLEEASKKEGGVRKQEPEKKAESGSKSGESGTKSNPFGNAKPRDETEYEKKRAEEKRKELEEIQRREAEAKDKEGRSADASKGRRGREGAAGGASGAGDWRNDAKPLDQRQRKPDAGRGARPGGKDGFKDRGQGSEGFKDGPGARDGKDWAGRESTGGQPQGREVRYVREGKGRDTAGGADGEGKKVEGKSEVASGAAEVAKKKPEAKKEAPPPPSQEKKAPVNRFDLLGEEDD